MKQRWAIGIDPGFGETGLVLRRGPEVKEFAVLSCPRRQHAPFARAVSLGDEISVVLEQWATRYKIEHLDVVIERPVYNANPQAFELQWRLVQQIESYLWFVLVILVEQLWVTEIGPSTSKKLATGHGDSTKIEVAGASPFERAKFTSETTWTTLGDAWAHSLAAWGNEGTGLRLDYTNLKFAEVTEK